MLFSSYKEEKFITKKHGNSENPFPKNWKGENGVYSVGFSGQGLLGVSTDAQRVAEDIAGQWRSGRLGQSNFT